MDKCKWDIPWDFYIGMAIAIMLLPIKWILSWLFAVCLHEGFHYLALRCLGGRVTGIRVRLWGIFMTTTPLTVKKEALAAIAGPVCGLFVLPVMRYVPRFSVCVLVQSVFNLIPLLPMDGGRVVNCVFHMLRKGWLFPIFQKCILVILGVAIVYFSFRFLLGPLPVLLFVLLYRRNRKSSCNQRGKRVQ